MTKSIHHLVHEIRIGQVAFYRFLVTLPFHSAMAGEVLKSSYPMAVFHQVSGHRPHQETFTPCYHCSHATGPMFRGSIRFSFELVL